jgi:hypothetical protein
MWALIDKEMVLKECNVYCWCPEENEFDDEEGAIWSLNYFFFNKERKRVAYIYVRGIPVMSHSPRQLSSIAKRTANGFSIDSGANKRARYWLGDRAADVTKGQDANPEDADITMWNSDDEVDSDDVDVLFDGDEFCDDYDDEADDESDRQDYKGPVRGVSEDIAASMDIEY